MSEETKSLAVLLPTIYKDLAQPTAQTVGQALGSIAGLVLRPIGRCADIATKNLLKFADKLDKEERDNIMPPDPNIGVPILQKLSYTEEEELVGLYTELLKNNCLKDKKGDVLPAYVDMISRLSSDEIKIINYIFKGKYVVSIPMASLATSHPELMKKIDQNAIDNTNEVSCSFHEIPFLEVRSHLKTKNEWNTLIKYFTDISDRVDIQKPENISLYFENLKAAGIFQIDNDIFSVPETVYNHLEKSETIIQQKVSIESQGRKIILKKGRISFTDLGLSFLKCCSPQKHSEN